MLREARIVMPHFASLTSQAAHHTLQQKLVAAFGGFTAYDGHGGWADPSGKVVQDMVTIYDIAIDSDRDGPWELIARFAVEAGRELSQDSVYVRYPNGEVDIIDIKSEEETAGKADRLLDALQNMFGPGFVVVDMGDGRSAEAHETDQLYKELTGRDYVPGVKHLPQPGELWETEAGAKVCIGKRATVIDGGWYVTVVDSGPTHDKPMFEYIVNLDGKLQPALPGHKSPRDLKRLIH